MACEDGTLAAKAAAKSRWQELQALAEEAAAAASVTRGKAVALHDHLLPPDNDEEKKEMTEEAANCLYDEIRLTILRALRISEATGVVLDHLRM